MVRRRLPCLRLTLFLNVDDVVSVDDKNWDEYANSNLALAVNVNNEGVGRWDGALGGEI